jgi:hypothetical protein
MTVFMHPTREMDPLGGLPDCVQPDQALDGEVNATSPEVGAQPVLIINVVAERRHQLAHLYGAPVRRAFFPPRAGRARRTSRVWSPHRWLLLLSGAKYVADYGLADHDATTYSAVGIDGCEPLSCSTLKTICTACGRAHLCRIVSLL